MKLGILGGGQLAQMLALAAYPLGIRTVCLDPNPTACARDVTEVMTADFTDDEALRRFLSTVDVVTYETENIPLACAEQVAALSHLHPSVATLRMTQDRWHEKNFFKSLNIPTAAFYSVASSQELVQATVQSGLPAVLKTRRMGYDGKGQCVIKTNGDINAAWDRLQNPELILEAFIEFEFEASIIAVRSRSGEIRFYPLIRNEHREGILRSSEVMLEDTHLQQQAQQYAVSILEALDYVGVFTLELFYDGARFLANEMAPRVHNSGHWTLEGAQTSQFENHLRAIFELPLGSTQTTGFSYMLNCVGEMPPIESCLSIPGAHYHTYGKEPRLNRKLGHVTLVDTDRSHYLQSKQLILNR